MKLDFNRPKGQIYGHSNAVYEQDGKLFDGAGELIESAVTAKPVSKEKAVETTKVETVDKEAVKAFLRETLYGAAVSETKLYKAVQETAFSWDVVKDVADSMTIRKYRQGSATMWKLMTD